MATAKRAPVTTPSALEKVNDFWFLAQAWGAAKWDIYKELRIQGVSPCALTQEDFLQAAPELRDSLRGIGNLETELLEILRAVVVEIANNSTRATTHSALRFALVTHRAQLEPSAVLALLALVLVDSGQLRFSEGGELPAMDIGALSFFVSSFGSAQGGDDVNASLGVAGFVLPQLTAMGLVETTHRKGAPSFANAVSLPQEVGAYLASGVMTAHHPAVVQQAVRPQLGYAFEKALLERSARHMRDQTSIWLIGDENASVEMFAEAVAGCDRSLLTTITIGSDIDVATALSTLRSGFAQAMCADTSALIVCRSHNTSVLSQVVSSLRQCGIASIVWFDGGMSTEQDEALTVFRAASEVLAPIHVVAPTAANLEMYWHQRWGGQVPKGCELATLQSVRRMSLRELEMLFPILVRDTSMPMSQVSLLFPPVFGALAKRIVPRKTFADGIFDDETEQALQGILDAAKFQEKVFNDWGLGDKISYGRCLSVLLSGAPGTGKTMSCEILGNELGRVMYRVDLSAVSSKYIGETEKQLAALFDEAERSGAILMFDEADAVFGKRTDVKSSNDRHANSMTNFLLQRLESFSGIVFLTTNHEHLIDVAFKRRMRYRFTFAEPSVDDRARLWAHFLPSGAPLADDVDVCALAERYAMSGGHIANAVARALFAAAAQGGVVTQQKLSHAAAIENAATGRVG